LVFLACAAAAVWPPVSRADELPSRTCLTVEPTAAEAALIQNDLQSRLESTVRVSDVGGIVQVAVHVLWDGVNGNVTDQQIERQIAELNRDFSGADGGWDTGYRFVLTSVDRTIDPTWFDLVQGSNAEKRMKEALAIDPEHHINIYTARFPALGWSTFPWGIPEDDAHHGIVIHYQSLPGGSTEHFNLGRTATHEIGHYLGLFHTFFSGCSMPNDYVADTPAQNSQTTGCPAEGFDSCALPGPDPIHNYLDYSWDECYAQFTAGQDARMDSMTAANRPHLIVAPLAVAERSRDRLGTLRPVMPNPASSRARIAFRLNAEARAMLRVHDLAGRVVARLVDGVLPAGDYVRVFEPPAGGSGVYFADLTVGYETMSRRVVVTR
jgi:hypothetical protein